VIKVKIPPINRSIRRFVAILSVTLFLTINLPSLVAQEEIISNSQISALLPCEVAVEDGEVLENQANYTYENEQTTFDGLSNALTSQIILDRGEIEISALGITRGDGETVQEEIAGVDFAGQLLIYSFAIENKGNLSADLTLPNPSTIQDSALTGVGEILGVEYIPVECEQRQEINEPVTITLKSGDSVPLFIRIQVPNTFAENDPISIGIRIGGQCGNSSAQLGVNIVTSPLIDPLGQITGCAGELLADYQGFSVGLFNPDPNDPTGGILGAVPLTTTEVPNNPNNNIPLGLAPNIENSNPFFLTNSDEGQYNFLFDEGRGQLDFGREYILLVNPPGDSIYNERRVRLTIGERIASNIIEYTAQSLDGRPLTVTDPFQRTVVTGQFVLIEDAERFGLNLAVLDLDTDVCLAQELRLDKSADRIATEPGDIVLYRLNARNLSPGTLRDIEINDQLPTGINLIPDSVEGRLGDQAVEINVTHGDRTITFSPDPNFELARGQVLNIVYAARVTPDAIRGSGRNSAILAGTINGITVRDGPAIHRLEIRSGILTDYGTIIGRVFVDKNFDGEQQPGEPGVPNAVIFLQNGNRITTDADGLFSVTNVLPGSYTGVLDPLSIPEYELAPNLYFSERNSRSRLVRVSPGSMVRMNFAVTPRAQEVGNE
jgi:uncharacterized repeat protein (TIGR01451 family)